MSVNPVHSSDLQTSHDVHDHTQNQTLTRSPQSQSSWHTCAWSADTSGYFAIPSIILIVVDDETLYLNVNANTVQASDIITLNSTITATDWALEGDTIITTSPRN
ncbi:hypothetical protein FISHEDRAFT_73717 [Fistulina hepatica ATCC 64428]|uniref:Uncharacterized protein n=1 Tax=Fistulina hepatica ATCC 64428 TaxID=1128425 RepID=A0A0D7ABK4_9AGAR|nr:hypothetical protein FISHEDRAFT_73717 [Fistulina hepatica ATCC 64428]